MDQTHLQALLIDLIASWENEVIEFKQAGKDYSTDDIGKYFSALANEANLREEEAACWFLGFITKHSKLSAPTIGCNLSDCKARRCRLLKIQSQVSLFAIFMNFKIPVGE